MQKASWNMTVGIILFASIAVFAACAGSTQGPSKAPGGAQVPGLYKNEHYRFTINYPTTWKTYPLAKENKNEIFRAALPNEYATPNVAAGVEKLNGPAVLDPKMTLEGTKASYPGTGRFKILEQEDIKLNDGTPAKAFTFQWNWSDGMTVLVSSALITIKDGNSFYTVATGVVGSVEPKSLLEIVKSWKFI